MQIHFFFLRKTTRLARLCRKALRIITFGPPVPSHRTGSTCVSQGCRDQAGVPLVLFSEASLAMPLTRQYVQKLGVCLCLGLLESSHCTHQSNESWSWTKAGQGHLGSWHFRPPWARLLHLAANARARVGGMLKQRCKKQLCRDFLVQPHLLPWGEAR